MEALLHSLAPPLIFFFFFFFFFFWGFFFLFAAPYPTHLSQPAPHAGLRPFSIRHKGGSCDYPFKSGSIPLPEPFVTLVDLLEGGTRDVAAPGGASNCSRRKPLGGAVVVEPGRWREWTLTLGPEASAPASGRSVGGFPYQSPQGCLVEAVQHVEEILAGDPVRVAFPRTRPGCRRAYSDAARLVVDLPGRRGAPPGARRARSGHLPLRPSRRWRAAAPQSPGLGRPARPGKERSGLANTRRRAGPSPAIPSSASLRTRASRSASRRRNRSACSPGALRSSRIGSERSATVSGSFPMSGDRLLREGWEKP